MLKKQIAPMAALVFGLSVSTQSFAAGYYDYYDYYDGGYTDSNGYNDDWFYDYYDYSYDYDYDEASDWFDWEEDGLFE